MRRPDQGLTCTQDICAQNQHSHAKAGQVEPKLARNGIRNGN